jgi:uncharacterized membrane protein YedE/YeeE
VGAGIGVLSWLAFLLLGHPLGITTGFTRILGLIEGPHAASVPYLAKLQPFLNFEVMLVLGVGLGAFASARLSRGMQTTAASRALPSLVGGFLLLFGARLAGGCTSGHGISGSLQLAVSGWLFFATIFASGMATAFLLYRKERLQ